MVFAAASAAKAMPVSVGPEAVVQLAAQLPTLLLPVPRRSAPETPAAPRKPRRMHRNGDRIGQHGQRATIGRSELAFAGAQPDLQLALRLAATGERPGMHPLGWFDHRWPAPCRRARSRGRAAAVPSGPWSPRPAVPRPRRRAARRAGTPPAPDHRGHRTAHHRRAVAAAAAKARPASTSSTVTKADQPTRGAAKRSSSATSPA